MSTVDVTPFVEMFSKLVSDMETAKEQIDAQRGNAKELRDKVKAQFATTEIGPTTAEETLVSFYDEIMEEDNAAVLFRTLSKASEILDALEEKVTDFLDREVRKQFASSTENLDTLRNNFTENREKASALRTSIVALDENYKGKLQEIPQLTRGGRPVGSKNKKPDSNIRYFYTMNGEKQEWDTLRKAVRYVSVECGGSGRENSLTLPEFREQFPNIKDDFSENWEVKLPSGVVFGFVRETV